MIRVLLFAFTACTTPYPTSQAYGCVEQSAFLLPIISTWWFSLSVCQPRKNDVAGMLGHDSWTSDLLVEY